jgi:hypothetical protein
MNAIEFVNALGGSKTVTFTKVDGSSRVMNCTRDSRSKSVV